MVAPSLSASVQYPARGSADVRLFTRESQEDRPVDWVGIEGRVGEIRRSVCPLPAANAVHPAHCRGRPTKTNPSARWSRMVGDGRSASLLTPWPDLPLYRKKQTSPLERYWPSASSWHGTARYIAACLCDWRTSPQTYRHQAAARVGHCHLCLATGVNAARIHWLEVGSRQRRWKAGRREGPSLRQLRVPSTESPAPRRVLATDPARRLRSATRCSCC